MKDFIKRWHARLDTGMASIAAVVVLIMMLLSSTDILLRYFFNRPIEGAYEAMQFMMGGVAFFGLSYVQGNRANITMDIISSRFSGKAELIIDIIMLAIMFAISAIIGWRGGANALDAWRAGDVTIGLVEYPVGPAKMVVPIGFGVLCLRLLAQFCQRVADLAKGIRKNRGA